MTVRRGRAIAEALPSTTSRRNIAAVHTRVPHELRRAYETARKLGEQLEVANLLVERRIVNHVREAIFLELMAVEGYVEVEAV